MVNLEKFDDLVIGGGKGGKSLAMALGPAGHRVALIEQGQIGGTCINVACIPTKTLVASAKVFHDAKNSEHFGLKLSADDSNFKGVIERKRRIVKGMVDAHHLLFSSTANMEFILGTAKFVDYKILEIDTAGGEKRLVTGERIFINTGSRTMIPNILGLAETGYLTSTSVMELESLPTHLAIVGGGYIALEFAQIFRRFGSEVTVIQRSEKFLPREDEDIAAAIKAVLEDEGIKFISDVEIISAAREVNSVTLQLNQNGRTFDLEASEILIATGRVSNNEMLQPEASGVKVDRRGYIEVSEYLETSAEGIWAIGDCNGGPHFTHTSWDDFRILRDNILFNKKRSTKNRLIPYTLFIDPELGRVGMTEAEARKAGYEILVATLPAAKIPRANTVGDTRGLLKAVIDKSSELILGCSIFAHEGGEVMSVVQMAIIAQVPYTQVRDTVWTHPTMAESLNLLFANVREV
ncbi:MAG: mercuric reductase [Leptolyngbya sp.]|nr:mercuric reductase [Candidatus Melainabacteria bacterium]